MKLNRTLPKVRQRIHTLFHLHTTPRGHTTALIGSALGLLLVFRTNAAYNRFWEGRQIWEKVHSQSRAIARFCMLYRDEIGKSKVGG